MGLTYVFEAKIVKSGDKYLVYPPKKYQQKLARLHGQTVKVILIKEDDEVENVTDIDRMVRAFAKIMEPAMDRLVARMVAESRSKEVLQELAKKISQELGRATVYEEKTREKKEEENTKKSNDVWYVMLDLMRELMREVAELEAKRGNEPKKLAKKELEWLQPRQHVRKKAEEKENQHKQGKREEKWSSEELLDRKYPVYTNTNKGS